MDDFILWWRNGGSQSWAKALDSEGGTLKAIEIVFNAGANSKDPAAKQIEQVKKTLKGRIV